MDRELLGLFALFAILVMAMVPAVLFSDTYEILTGEAFHGARGGAVRYVDVSYYEESVPNWHGVHGLVLSFWGNQTPFSFNGSAGDISRLDIMSSVGSGYIMITNSSSPPVVAELAPGNVSVLDGITGTGADAASNTFTSRSDFKFNSTTISSVPSATMASVAGVNGSYRMYFLQDSSSFIIAAPIELHMIGFNGEISDFEAMVPQGNETANRTYYVHLLMNYTAPPTTPTQPPAGGVGGSGGGGGGGGAAGGSSALSVSASIRFEGPFQIANNSGFREAVDGVWTEPLSNETMQTLAGFSSIAKGNFTGTAYLYSAGSTSVLMAVIRYAGDRVGPVVIWNRMPSYLTDPSLKVNAPGGSIYRMSDAERAFAYAAVDRDAQMLIVYRVERAANASVFNDMAFEVYAQPWQNLTAPSGCAEGERKCETGAAWLCSGGRWAVERCDFGCESGECLPAPPAQLDSISLLLLFLVWVILVMIMTVMLLIYRKMRIRAAIKRWT